MGLVPLKVVSNGKDITSVIRDFFVSLTINDEAGLESDNFQLVLADDGKVAFPRTEATMDIYTGQDFEHLVFRGSFTVNSVKLSNPDKTIVISGDAANLGGSFKTQRDQTWQNTDLKSMVETIAERNGFTPSVEEQYSEVAIPHFVQAGLSDADLVNELAKEHGATMKIASNKLIFFQKGNNVFRIS